MSIADSINRFFLKIDYFGVTIPFRLSGNKYHSSLTGGVVFLLYFLLVLGYGIYNFKVFITREEFRVVTELNKSFNPSEVTLNNTMLAIGVEGMSPAIRDKYFSFQVYQTTAIRDKGLDTKEYFNLSQCNHSQHFERFGISEQDFNAYSINNYFCPDFKGRKIQGQYINNVFSYFRIVMVLKDILNNTELLEAYNFILKQDIRLSIYYNDINVDLKNSNKGFDNFTSYFLNQFFINIGWNYYKKLNVFMSNNTVNVDDNPFISINGKTNFIVQLSTAPEYFLDFGFDRFNISKLKEQNPNFDIEKDYHNKYNILAAVYVRSSVYTDHTKVDYYKFTEMMADTTSILNICLIIVYVVLSSINEFLAVDTLVRKTMKFKGFLGEDDVFDVDYFNEVFSKMDTGISKVIREESMKIDSEDKSNNELKSEKVKKTIGGFEGEGYINIDERSLELSSDKNKISSDNPNSKLEKMKESASDLIIRKRREDELQSLKPSTSITKRRFAISKPSAKLKSKKVNVESFRFTCFESFVRMSKAFSLKLCCFLKYCVKKNDPSDMSYKKDILAAKGKKKFHFYIDFINYFRRMQELDILKYVLLNNDQIRLLNFISKPVVTEENKTEIYELLNVAYTANLNLNKPEIDKLKESYQNLVEKNSEINERLLSLAEYEISSILDKSPELNQSDSSTERQEKLEIAELVVIGRTLNDKHTENEKNADIEENKHSGKKEDALDADVDFVLPS